MVNRFIKENWGLIFINLFLAFYAVNEGLIRPGKEDFRVFLEAANALIQQSNLYFTNFPSIESGLTSYAYTPFWAMLLIPFKIFFSNKISVFIWLVINIGLLNRILIISVYILNPISKSIYYVLTVLLSLRFIMHNFDIAQMTIFWCYLMIEAYFQSEVRNKKLIPSLLISLGISIKFMPLLMLFYWFNRSQYSRIGLTLMLTGILTFTPYLFFSPQYLSIQFHDCLKVINPLQSGFNYNLFDQATQGIPSIISFYNDFLDFNTNEIYVLYLINITRITFLIWIYFIYKKYLTLLEYGNYCLLGLCLLMASLFMPHQQHYSFFSSIVLYSIWTDWLLSKRKSIRKLNLIFFLISCALMIFTSDIFVGSHLKSEFRTLKLIGIGGIILMIATHIELKNQKCLRTLRQT